MVDQLKMLPYNQENALVAMDDISSDKQSDLPDENWHVPESLVKNHVFRMAQTWIDWARQSMRLKFMVADIV